MANRWILLVFNVIVFLRIMVMFIFFMKRRMAADELASVSVEFAVYCAGFSWSAPQG
jgi:hypothetical protein